MISKDAIHIATTDFEYEGKPAIRADVVVNGVIARSSSMVQYPGDSRENTKRRAAVRALDELASELIAYNTVDRA